MIQLEYLAVTTLFGAIAAAVAYDLRDRRIPNLLVVCLLIAGLGLQTITFGAHGLVQALFGAATGGLLVAPFFIGGGMGAGDVKLLAAVGSFFGATGTISVLVFTLLTGGVIALGLLAWRKTGSLLCTPAATAESAPTGIPYACAIAVGSLLALLTSEPGGLPLMDMR